MEANVIDVQKPPITLTPQRVEPVVAWAFLGMFVVIMIIYIWGSWVFGPNFKPTPVGADPVPMSVKFWVRFLEVFSMTALAACLYFYIYRPWRKTGQMSFDGMMCLACFTLYVQDPILDYSSYWFLYNAYFVNFGSWTINIPGWATPRGNLIPEAILAWFGSYTWFVFVPVVIACKLTGWAKSRWPNLGPFTLIMGAYLAFVLLDLVLEGIFVRMGLYAFASVIPALTLWAGKPYQFPIYEALVWGSTWTVLFIFRYYRDDKGRSFAQRGIDRLRASTRLKRTLQFFAILGFVHATMFVTYNIPIQWFAMRGHRMPDYPSYLISGVCGPDTPFDCPALDVPIPRITTPTNRVVKP